MEIADICLLYADVIRIALPFTVVLWMSDTVVSIFLRAAFGGKLTLRGF